MNKTKATLKIAGREYPISVKPSEEENLRKAGKAINKMIKDFEDKYDVKDKQDALAMCSLQFATQMLSLKQEKSETEVHLQQRLQKLLASI